LPEARDRAAARLREPGVRRRGEAERDAATHAGQVEPADARPKTQPAEPVTAVSAPVLGLVAEEAEKQARAATRRREAGAIRILWRR
jgi:hypothetical protein